MSSVTRNAHAKLNAFLRVLGRRPDGFHEIQTAILPIELHDVVTVEEHRGLVIEVMGERAGELKRAGGESLVGRAAHAWASVAGVGAPRARILVDKRIPVAAGLFHLAYFFGLFLLYPHAPLWVMLILGFIYSLMVNANINGVGHNFIHNPFFRWQFLNRAFGTRFASEVLLEVAATVGSDVCALVSGGPVFADGRGDHVLPLHAPTSHWVVRPFPFAVRTPDAYGWWDERPSSGPDPGSLIAAIEVGNHDLAGSGLFDDLQPAVADRHAEVTRAVVAFAAAGALGAVMSGSGPTVVALARDPAHAAGIASAVPGSFVTTASPPAAPPRTIAEPSGVV